MLLLQIKNSMPTTSSMGAIGMFHNGGCNHVGEVFVYCGFCFVFLIVVTKFLTEIIYGREDLFQFLVSWYFLS